MRAEEIKRHREAMAEIDSAPPEAPAPPEKRKKPGPSLAKQAEEEIELPRRLDHNGQPWEANPRHRIADLVNGAPSIRASEEVYAYIKERLALNEFGALAFYFEDEILPALSGAGRGEEVEKVERALKIANSTKRKEV